MKSEQKNIPASHYRKKVQRTNRIAQRVITAGGYSIIISIAAILIFLVYQSLPLGSGAKIEEWLSMPSVSQTSDILLTGIDPYLEIFYEVDEKGNVNFYNLAQKKQMTQNNLPIPPGGKILSAAKGNLEKELIVVGSDSGMIITAQIEMTPQYTDSGRFIIPSMEILDEWKIPATNDTVPAHVEKIAYAQNEDDSRLWGCIDHAGGLNVRIYDADMDEEYIHSLSADIKDQNIVAMVISNNAENLVVASDNGNMYWFDLTDFEEIQLKDKWTVDSPVSAMSYLLGDQALALGAVDGSVSVWFPVRTPANLYKFRKVHTFTAHNRAVNKVYVSARNRDFLTIDSKGNAKLHYSTTGKTQVEFKAADFPIRTGAFAPKSNALFF